MDTKKDTKLKQIRKEKNFTQKQLAEATQISIRTLQHYEQGSKDLNMAAAITVYAIASALDVEMDELLDIEKPENDENPKKQ